MTVQDSRAHEPWLIHFIQRHSNDDAAETTPAVEFLDSVPVTVAAEFDAILAAVAAAPPPSFSGAGKWEAMHGDMSFGNRSRRTAMARRWRGRTLIHILEWH